MNNICSWRNLHEQFSFSKWVSLSPVKRELKNWDKLCPRILGEGKFRRNKILLNVKKFIWVVAGWSCVLLNWHQTGAQLYLILSPDIFSCIKECRIVWRCSRRFFEGISASCLQHIGTIPQWWAVVGSGQKIGLFSFWNGHLDCWKKRKSKKQWESFSLPSLLPFCI